MLKRVIIGLVLLAAVGALGFAALAWRPALGPTSAVAAFDPAQIARGRQVALLGNCNACHLGSDGAALSGGRPVETPFGTIYASNISPDAETGIGLWPREAFARAVREGVDREGHHLYPAHPYDHYAKVSDADVDALYAYAMTRPAARRAVPAPDLPFPLNQRPLLAGWKLLFFRNARFAPDPAHDEAWNRGAYLSEGLGHCGACHTPRNALGAEIAAKHYDGGHADGWWSPPLNATTPATVPWTQESLFRYLREWDDHHGGAAGPMAAVVENLSQVPESDVRAMAAYTASLMGPPSAERLARTEAIAARSDAAPDPALREGERLYAGACATCHASGGAVAYTVRSLGYHTTLAGPDPRNVIRVVLQGIHPAEGGFGAIMPGFAEALTDRQVADLMDYLRARFTDAPPWEKVEDTVRAVRAESAPRSGGRPAGREARLGKRGTAP